MLNTKDIALKSFIRPFLANRAMRLIYFYIGRFYTFFSYKKAIKLRSKFNDIFYGYYDHNPLNLEKKFHLAHRRKITNYGYPKELNVDIGFFDLKNNKKEFIKLASSGCWSWQQGTRLRWHPIFKQELIFNTLNNGKLSTCIINLENKKKIYYPFPFYEISPDSKKLYSLSFTELEKKRQGYGYGHSNNVIGIKDPFEGDGCMKVYEYDISSKKLKVLISLTDLESLGLLERKIDNTDYINHLSLSKNGEWISFIHLAKVNNRRYSDLYIINKSGNKIKKITNTSTASHYSWIDDKSLSIFCVGKNSKLNTYHIFDVENDTEILLDSTKSNKILFKDGHQSHLSRFEIISDTYPNIFRIQKLYLFSKNKCKTLANLSSPLRYTREVRCDLHPRLIQADNMISVDSTHNEKREILIFNI